MKIDDYRRRNLVDSHVSSVLLENRSVVFMAFFIYFDIYILNLDTTLKNKIKPYIPYHKLWAMVASNNSFLVEWLKY